MASESRVPTLELLVEHAVVHRFVLAPGQHLVGRGDAAEIRLLDNAVSTRHATVTVIESPDFPGHFETMLEDSGSKNGTQVNGEPVQAHELQHGDQVMFGHTLMRYVEPGAEDATETGVLLRD